ncbi:MAG: OmpH family outer membrane protein, partial [Acidobacteria bacterium]|nr:OmpH family outer membrane protein [Acidobacteriota bacterium]
MKTFRLILIGAFLTAIFAISAFAQGNGQIAVINTLAFGGDEKGAGGITKYISAQKRLDDEFKVENQQLTTLQTKINGLKTEIANLQKASTAGTPVNPKAITDKAQAHDNLVREYKFKEESAKAKFEVRLDAVMGPVNEDISKAMQEFAKKNGYSIILDAARLDRAGLILA